MERFFDNLARALAKDLTRREAFRMTFLGLVGGLFGWTGRTGQFTAARAALASRSGAAGCDLDVPTIDAIEAARAALQGGATDVALSPGGCIRYSRVIRDDGTRSSEQITFDGVAALVWTHTDVQSTGQRDADLDGFFETQIVVNRDVSSPQTQITYYSPDHTLSRETYSPRTDVVHVVWEVSDGAGGLQTIAIFDADLLEERAWSRDHAVITATTFSGCTDDQAAQLQDRLKHAIDALSSALFVRAPAAPTRSSTFRVARSVWSPARVASPALAITRASRWMSRAARLRVPKSSRGLNADCLLKMSFPMFRLATRKSLMAR